MTRVLLHCCCFLLFINAAVAQKNELLVKSGDKGLYLDHKVAPKESFYAIGRLYNVSPKYLAAYNKLDLNKGLQIDQKLRIPLTDTNFVQSGNTGTPVYYKTGKDEGLMSVSNKNNKVLLANLRSWNGLSSDNLQENSKLVIGFLKSSEMPAITITPKTTNEPVAKNEVKKTDESKTSSKPIEEAPVLTKDEKKQEKKQAEDELKGEEKDEKKDEKEQKKKPEIITASVKTSGNASEGYFKTHFEQQVRNNPVTKNETVTAGIFKTASGWQDEKYYLMIDRVAPGTIVKIINPSNNKAIYAKVLGEMSGIRQNEGLNIRISNAAASSLDIADQDKFIVKVAY